MDHAGRWRDAMRMVPFFSVTLSRHTSTCSLFFTCYFRMIMQYNVVSSSRLFSAVSPVLRMCLQRSSGKGRWNGWTCSATGTSGWSRDSIRSAPGFNLIMQNVSWLVCMSCMVMPNWICQICLSSVFFPKGFRKQASPLYLHCFHVTAFQS